MSKLIGVDTYLGGDEVDRRVTSTRRLAALEALISADMALKPGGGVLLSIADRHKTQMLPVIHHLHDAGFRLFATEGTAGMIAALGLAVEQVTKRLNEGHPNVVDVINDGSVSCVINTPEGRYTGTLRDGFYIRRAATEKRIPCFTSIDTARRHRGDRACATANEQATVRPFPSTATASLCLAAPGVARPSADGRTAPALRQARHRWIRRPGPHRALRARSSRSWLDARRRFIDALADDILPSPSSTEMAIHVRHRRAGVAGGISPTLRSSRRRSDDAGVELGVLPVEQRRCDPTSSMASSRPSSPSSPSRCGVSSARRSATCHSSG
jgi:hypothetical protein